MSIGRGHRNKDTSYNCGSYGLKELQCRRNQHDGINNDSRENVAQGGELSVETNVDEVQ